MNLFTARLTGKMLSTDAFEKEIADMQARVKRWRAIEKSPELAEYNELKKLIESSDFRERKNELEKRKYKDTQEGKKMMEYEALANSSSIRSYRRALKDKEFQDFLVFRESEDFQKIKSLKAVLTDPLIRKYRMLYYSSKYKNYLKMLNSPDLKRLADLEEEVHTEDFQKRHAVWADSKRWSHSDLLQKQQRYEQLAKSDDIKFFFESRKEKIDWAELFRPAFDDDMSSNKNWKPGYGYASPVMKDGHSRTSELQAYNNGKNTFFAEGRMDLETRNESKKAIAWDEKKGFTEHVFDYTSDVMNTKDAFMQEEGLFMAKVRSQGAGHHFFGLSTGKPGNPMVALYHCNGSKPQMGLIQGDRTQMADLTGLLPANYFYFIYSLRWTKHELIWYVNNLELLRLPNRLPKEAMFFLAQSFLPSNEKGGEGKLKVRWARVYRSVE